jgi:hypothetical protein
MSLLSDFYIATPETAVAYDTDPGLPDNERAQFQGLTYEDMANLWASIENTEATPEHSDAFETILVIDDGQRLINRFPTEFVATLASLDESSTSAAAAKWIQTSELAYMNCEPSDVLPIIETLSRLARTAQQCGKSLYLWMCV